MKIYQSQLVVLYQFCTFSNLLGVQINKQLINYQLINHIDRFTIPWQDVIFPDNVDFTMKNVKGTHYSTIK